MRKQDMPALTGLRGVAALLIVVHHVGLIMLPFNGTVIGPALEKCGLLGMSIFFVLSGFVIHYNYADKLASGRRGIADFLVARFARLYPLYLIFVVGNFFYNYSISPNYAKFLIPNLLGIQSWVYLTSGTTNVTLSQIYANNAWSISTEVMLYLLFIPIALFGRFRSASMRKGLALLVFAMAGRMVFVQHADSMGHALAQAFGETPSLPADQWLTYFSPYGRIFEFLAGAALAEIWMARSLTVTEKRIAGYLGLGALAYIAATFLDGTLFSLPRFFEGDHLYTGYAVAVPLSIFSLCLWRKFLSGAIAIALGNASYSIYLLHSDLFPVFHVAAGAPVWVMAVNLAAFSFVLALSSLLAYRYLEMPSKNFINHWYRQRKIRQLYSHTMTFPLTPLEPAAALELAGIAAPLPPAPLPPFELNPIAAMPPSDG